MYRSHISRHPWTNQSPLDESRPRNRHEAQVSENNELGAREIQINAPNASPITAATHTCIQSRRSPSSRGPRSDNDEWRELDGRSEEQVETKQTDQRKTNARRVGPILFIRLVHVPDNMERRHLHIRVYVGDSGSARHPDPSGRLCVLRTVEGPLLCTQSPRHQRAISTRSSGVHHWQREGRRKRYVLPKPNLRTID